MIKIKLSSVGKENTTEIDLIPGEMLDYSVERAVGHLKVEDKALHDLFIVLVNGHKIPHELWSTVKCTQGDNILIAPLLKEGDNSSIFKTAIIIAATAYLGPAVAGYYGFAAATVGAALITAGVSIGTSLLLNSLIPPPVPEGLDIGNGGDVGGSQMYSVTGQSNQTKKLATVPKVYGTHRMFPIVAANPYTELETDPLTGKLVQYFYCVYDFGLGPLVLSDLRIGDTPITDFADVQYKLVDFNRPVISEGTWDDPLNTTLQLYKGEVEADPTAVAINKNQGQGALSEYEVTRNSAPNTKNTTQEITLSFTNPLGLYGINNAGSIGERTIALDIYFSKVGEDVWRPFNDPTYVYDYLDTGGSDAFSLQNVELLSLYATAPSGTSYPAAGPYYSLLGSFVNYTFLMGYTFGVPETFTTYNYGLPKGATSIILKTTTGLVGKDLRIRGNYIGKITSGVAHPVTGYTTYTFDTPTTEAISLYTIYRDGFGQPLATSQLSSYYKDTEVPQYVQSAQRVLGRVQITRASTSPVYSTFRFTPKETASYKIRVTRVSTTGSFNSTVQDNLTWSGLSTRFDQTPILTDKRHVFMEIRIRATNQLNGAIQNLSGICSSVLEVYDGSTWNKEVSSNPAWVFADLLTGEVNKRPLDKSRLDTASLLEWAAFCDQVPTPPPSMSYTFERFSSNFILDYSPTLQTVLNQVTSAAQASLNIIDGKYGVLIDKLRTVPVQVFTPRNSSNFSSTRNYSNQPNALKVLYIDPLANWEGREKIVYDTGYDEVSAETFDEVQSFGCTNMEQAWRLGRYMLAQNRLRQENMTIQVDFENLVCTRGDFVQITQDVMSVGGTPARVYSISGNQIQIDDAIETGPFTYGFVFRSQTGEIHTNTLTVVNATTFDLDGPDLPQQGDLIVIGVMDSIVMDCIVKSIDPGDNLTATLTLVEKADAVYEAESTDTIPDYSPQLAPTTDIDFLPPGEVENLVVADYYYECNGAGLDYNVLIDWDVPMGAAYDIFEVYVDSGAGYNLVANTKESFYLYTALEENLGIEHKFKVLAVSARGAKLEIGQVTGVTQLITRKTSPPANVGALSIDITNEVLQIVWEEVEDCSVEEYLVRYSPNLNGTWEQSIPLLRTARNATLASTQARTGIYLIKAVDYEGNESLIATAAITTIPQLFNLNVIDETTDFPGLPGSKDRTKVETGALILKNTVLGGVDTAEYEPEGFYYYEQFLDLGEIYTVRLQSLIQAEGFELSDLMSNWPDLSSLTAMSHAGFSDWDVETQYRTTESFNVMSDWPSLDVIDPISEGDQDNWTAWKKFIMGDATGRIFQFRLRLLSFKPSVSPRVFDGTIRADMPDRIESYENMLVPDTGLAVMYTPAFKGPGSSPNIQVSLQDGLAGDHWVFTSRTLDGFSIQFLDENDNPVERTADFSIKGYGRKNTSVI